MKKGIAFFDFDGTITKKDTLLEFIRFTKGSFSFYTGFLVNLPYLFAYKFKIISNQSAKERVLKFFFNGTAVEEFNRKCQQFAELIVPKLVRLKALDEIERLKGLNITVVVVSASPENWIEHWTKALGLELIASRLEILNGKVTGKILGQNCHGDEKVVRIKEVYDLSSYNIIAAYGDSGGDKPMLALAEHAYYRPFK